MRRKACDGNEESHDLGSKRSAKFVCEETRDRNAVSPLFYVRGTRDHRIGKSSSAVSCNYDPMDKGVRVRFCRIYIIYIHTYIYVVIVCREIIIRHFFPSSALPRYPNHSLSVALACVPGWLRADRISVRVHRGLNDIALFRIERQPVSLFV